ILLRIVGDKQIGVWLESDGTGAQQIGSVGTIHGKGRASGMERQGAHRLIERVQKINMRTESSCGLGIRDGGCARNRINSNALHRLRNTNFKIRIAEESK